MSDAGYYLVDNPPRRSQYRKPRRDKPSGVIVLHSTESVADVHPPDGGAESVARFIRDRDTAGSYHRLVDADSIVKMIPFWYEAFHDGTGTNRHTIGMSFAWQAHKVSSLPAEYVDAAYRQMAKAVAEAITWLATQEVTVPLKQITVDQARNRQPGFVTHGMLDPSRRSDPDGTNNGSRVDWDRLFRYVRELQEDDDMAQVMAWFRAKAGDKHGHCYRIAGTTATWFSTHEEINTARYFGLQWAGGTEANSMMDPVMWKSLAVLNGPLQNVYDRSLRASLGALLDDEAVLLKAIKDAADSSGGSDPEAIAQATIAALKEAL